MRRRGGGGRGLASQRPLSAPHLLGSFFTALGYLSLAGSCPSRTFTLAGKVEKRAGFSRNGDARGRDGAGEKVNAKRFFQTFLFRIRYLHKVSMRL
jgi:hypothetical protein